MEDVLFALLSAAGELLFEVLAQLLLEEVVALMIRSVRRLSGEMNSVSPTFAAAGYLLLGSAFGAASVLIFPHALFRPSRFHGVSILVSPIITGVVMSQAGRAFRRVGKQAVRIESFGYGFAFTLGWAIVRFVAVN